MQWVFILTKAQQRLPDYLPVKFSLNATLSSLDYQYLLWIMRHKGINFQQIIAPKSTNKL